MAVMQSISYNVARRNGLRREMEKNLEAIKSGIISRIFARLVRKAGS